MVRRKAAFATAVALLLGAGAAHAGTVYLAPQEANQIGFSYNGAAVGVGNTITLSGSGSHHLGTVDLFGYAGGGSLPIEVSLYAGSDPNSGALLGSETVVPTGNGYTTEVLNFGSLVVPQTLTYIVSIVGNSGSYDDSFVDWQQFTGAAGSPSVGSSGNMWFGTSPGNFAIDNAYAMATGASSDTLAAQFNAVPEPATWAMLLVGVGMIGAGLRRRNVMARAAA